MCCPKTNDKSNLLDLSDLRISEGKVTRQTELGVQDWGPWLTVDFSSSVIMRFIDLRKRLCQDRHSPGPDINSTKQRLPDDCVLLSRKSESSLQLNIESFHTKLNLSPGGRTKSEVIQKLPESPSSVNIDLSYDNDSGRDQIGY